MSISIEVAFDPASTAAVRELWRAVEARCPESGLSDTVTDPHVSLALLPDHVEAPTADAFAESAARTEPMTVDVTGLSTFPGGEGVLFLRVRTCDALAELHASVHTVLEAEALRSNPVYVGMAWVPHCTLGLGLAPPLARELAGSLEPPSRLRLTRLRAVHYGEQALLWELPLAGRP